MARFKLNRESLNRLFNDNYSNTPTTGTMTHETAVTTSIEDSITMRGERVANISYVDPPHDAVTNTLSTNTNTVTTARVIDLRDRIISRSQDQDMSARVVAEDVAWKPFEFSPHFFARSVSCTSIATLPHTVGIPEEILCKRALALVVKDFIHKTFILFNEYYYMLPYSTEFGTIFENRFRNFSHRLQTNDKTKYIKPISDDDMVNEMYQYFEQHIESDKTLPTKKQLRYLFGEKLPNISIQLIKGEKQVKVAYNVDFNNKYIV